MRPERCVSPVGEAKFADRGGDLRDLRVAVRARVSGVGDQRRAPAPNKSSRVIHNILTNPIRIIFDGVIAGTGLLPEVISDAIERVAAGAREAGRDQSEVDVWFTTRSSLDADRDKAIERIHASVSSILNHSMRFGLEGKNVPTQFRAKIAEYVGGYELYDHVLQAGRNPKRMARPLRRSAPGW
jgi:hypothetical protein